MAFRFADLPIRTKFLITLGIPVLGLVLLITFFNLRALFYTSRR